MFPPSGKMARKRGRVATYPILGHPCFSYPKHRIYGDIPYSMWVNVPFPNRPYSWIRGPRNLGPNIKGEIELGTILVETSKIHQKVVPPKIISPVPK